MKLLIELDEEYVKVIDKIKFLVGGRTDRKLQLEIIKAIKNGKPLDRASTTKNDLGVDCISRKADMHYPPESESAYEKALLKAYADGQASVEPKRGHWITKEGIYGVSYCSECDFELKIDDTNYCPNCGARMFEPQESEVTYETI